MKNILLFSFPILLISSCSDSASREEAEKLWAEGSIAIHAIKNSTGLGRGQFGDNVRQTEYLIAETERQKNTLSKATYQDLKNKLGEIKNTFGRLSEDYLVASTDGQIRSVEYYYDNLKRDIDNPDESCWISSCSRTR